MRKVVLFAPALFTGGPFAIYQLADSILKYGINAEIAFYDHGNIQFNGDQCIISYPRNFAPPGLLGITPILCNNISRDDFIIFPEVTISLLIEFQKKQYNNCVLWWLSWNNFPISSIEEIDIVSSLSRCIHIFQSEYAMYNARKFGYNGLMVSDYTKVEDLQKKEWGDRKYLFSYLPRKSKGAESVLNKISQESLICRIEGMSRDQVCQALAESKFFIDFGHQPGKDRMPREAALLGCIPVVRLAGAARFFQDFPLPDYLKPKSEVLLQSTGLSQLIKLISENNKAVLGELDLYVTEINNEKYRFEQQVCSLLHQLQLSSPGSHGDLTGTTAAFSFPYEQIEPTPDVPRCIKKADAQAEISCLPDSAIQHWMSYRALSPVQQEFVDDYLQEQSGGPCIGLLLLDRAGDLAAVEQTLASLKHQHYSHVVIGLVTALATDQPLPEHWPDTVLRLAAPDQAAEALNRLAGQLEADWYLQLQAGETLTDNGLLICALELMGTPDCRAIYADQLQRSAEGAQEIVLRPDFNLDLLLGFPRSMASHWLVRRDIFLEAGGYDACFDGAMEFDLVLRLLERGGMAGLGHVAEPLLMTDALQAPPVEHEVQTLQRHLALRGYAQAEITPTAPGCYHIAYRHEDQPLVSIILPVQDQLALAQRCAMSVLEHTRYRRCELLIVDNASRTAATREWLAGVEQMGAQQVQVLRADTVLSPAALLNQAALQARGDYLVLLSPDCAVFRPDWLDELLNQAQRPEVGIVGSKLVSADEKITHAGLVLGLNGIAGRAFQGEPMEASGYMSRLWVAQNYSAVAGDGLMVRRSLYLELGGLDEGAFAERGAEVDLCLRVTEANYLVVWTPHAMLLDNRLPEPEPVALQDAFYARWLPRLARDPAYNPNFSLGRSPAGFALTDSQLTWKPLVWQPVPVVMAHYADTFGCGHYRVIQPFHAQRDAGLIQGVITHNLMPVLDLERYSPDVILLQRQIGEERLEAMRRMKAFSTAFRVYELDDYLPSLPLKNMHRETMPRDIVKSLRRGLGYVDRFVVSTEALAEAFGGFHQRIQVMQNRLYPQWWGADVLPASQRRRGEKPRVGWAGGVSHTGDLELIADVVAALAGEVEWVFMGLCPDKLRPFVHEFNQGVEISQYPAALARLDLDLALAPLENNLFNECKSNLRLLEYGACGFPVICSDLRCYAGDLPVTRVKNRYASWVEAIRMHLADLDETARWGDRLRDQVRQHWMLEGDNLQAWYRAWQPD